jgi:hypothetical protein
MPVWQISNLGKEAIGIYESDLPKRILNDKAVGPDDIRRFPLRFMFVKLQSLPTL